MSTVSDVSAGAVADTGAVAGADTRRELGAAFKATMAAVRRLRGRETHRAGQLSYAQYMLLFSLAGGATCGAGPMSARVLAESAELTPATVTQMLDGLETAGLVQRTRSAEDRRVVLSSLTPRGEQLVTERHAQMEPRWRAALAEFDDDELRTATRVLHRLAEYFTVLGEGD